jgi:hypothetical protein
MNQLPIDFTVHKAENNPASQKHLDANRAKFTAKCAEVYRRLMAGDRLTVLACANAGISSLPRRILDLRERGVCISDEWQDGVKVYYASSTDLAFNRWHFADQAAA